MNKEIKTLWTAALLSGKYRQGTGFLKINGRNGAEDRFCCLGVLCELAVEAGVTERLSEDYETVYGKVGDSNTAILPLHIQEWAGIVGRGGSYASGERSLASDNDSGMTFPEIVDAINENF